MEAGPTMNLGATSWRTTMMALVAGAAVMIGGCFPLRSSEGGGQTEYSPPRVLDADDVAVPAGYEIELVAKGFTFPTAVAIDAKGRPHVVEAGYSYGGEFAVPRLLRVARDGTVEEIARGEQGPWTGAVFHEGLFYVTASGTAGRVLEISPDGRVRQLVDGLPGRGDHHTNAPAVGPEGFVYFGQGTMTNSGVVGPDNYDFGWLRKHPGWHDIACKTVTLAGKDFATENLFAPGNAAENVRTGAYVPYGTATQKGRRIEGEIPCSGAVFRVSPRSGALELVAWGLRNPFGLAFSPTGALFATENGADVRGSRPIFGAPDYLWSIEEGSWYGWPDFVGGVPVTDPRFQPPDGPQPEFLLLEHPQTPPRPQAAFGVHSSSNGLDFSHSPAFGHVGDAFVAQFGDMAPSTGKVLSPTGFRVVHVDPETGVIDAFATNREGNGPASFLDTGGLERPVDVQFSPDGSALYVVDFGVMTMTDNGPVPHQGTGVLWRIHRTGPEEQ